MAHAAQAPVRCLELCLEDVGNAITKREVDVRDDARGDLALATRRLDGLTGEAHDPLDFADRSHGFRSGLSPSGFVGLDVDGADDPVATRNVVPKILEPVMNRVAGRAEEMVMRIDDGQLRLQRVTWARAACQSASSRVVLGKVPR